jgi:hypothetical protein
MIRILMNALRQQRNRLHYRLLCRLPMIRDVVLELITTLILTHSAPNMEMMKTARRWLYVTGSLANMLNVNHQRFLQRKRPAPLLLHRQHHQHLDAVTVTVNTRHSASAWKMRHRAAEHRIVIGKRRMITRCVSHQHRHRPLQHLCMMRDAVPDIHRRRIHSVCSMKRERNAKTPECAHGFPPMIQMIAF